MHLPGKERIKLVFLPGQLFPKGSWWLFSITLQRSTALRLGCVDSYLTSPGCDLSFPPRSSRNTPGIPSRAPILGRRCDVKDMMDANGW
jgi:hypothetical protein